MPKDLKPALLLVSLFVIVIFLFGFRLGKKVEQLNKNFALTPTPTRPVTTTPTEAPTVSYATYVSPGCALTLLYPEGFTEQKPSSTEARLIKGAQEIYFTCEKTAVQEAQKQATGEAKTVKVGTQSVRMFEKGGNNSWIVLNTLTGRRILFETSVALTDLVLRTLQFARR